MNCTIEENRRSEDKLSPWLTQVHTSKYCFSFFAGHIVVTNRQRDRLADAETKTMLLCL